MKVFCLWRMNLHYNYCGPAELLGLYSTDEIAQENRKNIVVLPNELVHVNVNELDAITFPANGGIPPSPND